MRARPWPSWRNRLPRPNQCIRRPVRLQFRGLRQRVAARTLRQSDRGLAEASAYWLSRDLLKWPGADAAGTFKLYYSASGHLSRSGDRVSGADGWLPLQAFAGKLPGTLAERFGFVGEGVVLGVTADDAVKLPTLHRGQILVAQEDGKGKLQKLASLQLAGALDDQFSEAEWCRTWRHGGPGA